MHPDLNTVILVLGFIIAIASNKVDTHKLSDRIDRISERLSDRIDRLSDKLDAINLRLGEHTADLKNLKENQTSKVS